jgi:hypothetical protein
VTGNWNEVPIRGGGSITPPRHKTLAH